MTIWGYILLKDSYYLTPLLLGNGDLKLSVKDFPVHKKPDNLKYYYLTSMGYHVFALFHHAMEKKRNDFIEMFLHHFVTVFLYAFSYFCNFTVAGSIIMFLHDIADIFTAGVQCFTETIFNNLSIFFGIGMAISWFYTRIIVFSIVIYYTAFESYYFHTNPISSYA